MSDKNPNPNDWNRDYTVGTGRSSGMFWLGMAFLVLFFGWIGWPWILGLLDGLVR